MLEDYHPRAHAARASNAVGREAPRSLFVWCFARFLSQLRSEVQVIMLRAAVSLFVIACVAAVIAAIFGWGGIAAGAAGVARIFFYCAVGIAVIAMIGALLFGRSEEA